MLLVLNNPWGQFFLPFVPKVKRRNVDLSTHRHLLGFRDTGLFSIYAGTSRKTFPRSCINLERAETRREEPVRPKLNRAKEQIETSGLVWRIRPTG